MLLPVTKYAEMKKIYKAHIFYTKEQNRFEVLENGYVAVSTDGHVKGVATDLSALNCCLGYRTTPFPRK